MAEIALSQGKVTVVDDADAGWLSQWRWFYVQTKGREYAIRHEMHGRKQIPIYMHRLILGCTPSEECDHINGNGLDQRRTNLRKCSHQQNQCNQRKRRGGTSRYKGVSWYPRGGKWRALAAKKFLGYFASEIDAARAYNAAASEMFGEFARLNEMPQEAANADAIPER